MSNEEAVVLVQIKKEKKHRVADGQRRCFWRSTAWPGGDPGVDGDGEARRGVGLSLVAVWSHGSGPEGRFA